MIETKRLLIKPLSSDELKKLIESPSDLADEMGLIPSQSLIDKEARNAILNDLLPNLSDPEKDASFYTMWIVIEKLKKAIIGGICFHGEPDENGEVEIGYGIDNNYMNKGYMTETISGIINWIRNKKEVRIIKAETDSSNISSIRVLEKNGFELVQQNDNMIILKLELTVRQAERNNRNDS
jgi:[ribosomal protein S5]-alanine N-acetyltransferase